MEYTNYIIFILIIILLLSIFLYKNIAIKESLAQNAKKSVSSNEGTIDKMNYDTQIIDLTDRYNFLMGRVPIRFYAGNIEYSYDTDIPLVVFSGGVPYVYVNMQLPYPLPGNKGDPGDPGSPGIPGPQGIQGKSGLSGYSGLSYSNFLNSKK